MGLFLRKNHLLRYWGCPSLLNWIGGLTLSPFLILAPRKWIRSMWFLSHEVALYLYKSTIHPCMEYCCHIWAGGPICHMQMIDKLQKYVGLLVLYLLPLLKSWLIVETNTSLSLFYRYYFGRCSFELQSWSKCFEAFFIFHQISLSPQVKRSLIIGNKHGICELPHELPNDLRLRILRN